MRHLRRAFLAAAVVALSAASAAAAHHPHSGGGAAVVPAGGKVMGQWYKTFLEMPAAVNPLAGKGDPCVRFGHKGKLLSAIARDGTVSCIAERGTVLVTGADHFCSTFDDPPFYAVSESAQRRSARAASSSETRITVTVDGHKVDILNRRFAAYSPQTKVQLPPGNIADVDAKPGTLTAYGWNASVRNLGVGEHLIITEISYDGGEPVPYRHYITIVPRGHSDED